MKMKKITFLLVLCVLLNTLFALPVSAMKVGDVLGNVLYSDIMAFINGKQIPTSVTNGKTMVVVEDLSNYGFDVTWDGKDKTLKVEYNPNKQFKEMEVERNTKPTGTFKCYYVYTDIKTYLSGKKVESVAITGKTMIDFEALSVYGALSWDSGTKTIRLSVNRPLSSLTWDELSSLSKSADYRQQNAAIIEMATRNAEMSLDAQIKIQNEAAKSPASTQKTPSSNSSSSTTIIISTPNYSSSTPSSNPSSGSNANYNSSETNPIPAATQAPVNTQNDNLEYKFVSNYKYDNNGTVYYGILKNGKPDVYGAMINEKTGYFYMGGYKDGKMNTYLYDKDGSLKSAGSGLLKNSDGSRLCSNFKDGNANGDYAAYITNEDKLYTGKFTDGKLSNAELMGKSIFDMGYKYLFNDWLILETTGDTSGIKYIKLINDKSKVSSDWGGYTYKNQYNQYAKNINPTIKISPDGSVLMGIMGDYAKSNYIIQYDAKTGNWKAGTQLLTEGNVNSDAGAIGKTIMYYNGEIIDYRYDINGNVISGQMPSGSTNGGNSNSNSNSTPSYTPPPSQTAPTYTPPKQELCPHCNGTGRILCAACHGSGVVTTYHHGLYGTEDYWTNDNCKSCGGLGYKLCAYCNGTGLKLIR